MNSFASKVLFLCTGNYYRSRFAEYLFNHLAATRQIGWRANSRGLAIELVDADAGPISPFTLEGLARWGIATEARIRGPIQVSVADLIEADLVVALKQSEHLPLLRRRYPGWEDRVEFWHVDDIDVANPKDALPVLESSIHDLLGRLG